MGDGIRVADAARLLGIDRRVLHQLIESAAVGATRIDDVDETGRPGRRHSLAFTRAEIDDLINGARVSPGTLRHLYVRASAPPDADVGRIERFCAEVLTPAIGGGDGRVVVSVRGMSATLSLRRPLRTGAQRRRGGIPIARLRYEPRSGMWSLYAADGNAAWRPWQAAGEKCADLDTLLDVLESAAPLDAAG